MPPLINRQSAVRLAGLELNAMAAAGAIPSAPFDGARVVGGTPIYDIDGEILFYRVPIRGGAVDAFVDIAAFAGFGDTLLRVGHGFPWNEKELVASAAAAARKQQRGLRYGRARFVAYSYPKIAVQFLADDEEVVMIEIGSGKPVPPRRPRKGDEPPSDFERWSFIEEVSPRRMRAAEQRIAEKVRQWEELAPARKLDARIVDPLRFTRVVGPALLARVESRQVAYSPTAGDHVPCFELRGQQTNVWCVAGSVQMILDFYRYNYQQTRIAADLGLGTLANPNGLPYSQDNQVVVVLESLTGNALDASMNTSPNWNEFRDEIRANRPLISFIPGHSRCVAGYTSTRMFTWYQFRGLLVYDPWPPNSGVITQWENFDATTYRRTFTAHVTLV